jgi:hypothetical protein
MKGKIIIIFILLTATFSTLITGCQKKAEEKMAEKIIEDATGAEVDISGDTTTIKTEKGETKIGENQKWPKDKMGDLPELKANITMVMEDYDKEKDINLGMVYFDSLKKDDAEKYLGYIKELKYESFFEVFNDDGFIYSGKNEDGAEVVFSYTDDGGTGSLSYTDNQFMFVENPYDSNSSGDSPLSEDVDMTDDVPWPEEFFDDIPEIEGKITQVSSGSPQDKFVYIEYVTKENALDYLNQLKEIGFIDSPSESLSGSYINYEASNEDGDYIVFDWSDSEYATISLLKGE